MIYIYEHPEVSGLFYVDNFIPDSEELLREIDSRPWTSVTASVNSRLVQQYGYEYVYKRGPRQEATRVEAFFPLLEMLRDRVDEVTGALRLTTPHLNQSIINNYKPGQGISAHTDSKIFGPVICCLTLNSGAEMKFTRDGREVSFLTKPGQLYIMSGDARERWTHEMPSRLVDGDSKRGRRVSVTFRSVI
jgi:alkylated DNA repair dioxygenase AlkB